MMEEVKLRFTMGEATARRAARVAVRWRNMALSIEVWGSGGSISEVVKVAR